MQWRKVGKIFDPTEYSLPNRCVEFSQSPQALVLEDRVRLYFSTRERDNVGKYLSHVAFVDFDRAMRSVLGVSSQTVISLGGLGCFDEHGIFPFSVLNVGDRVLAYTSGWNRRASVSVDAAVGLAISHDNGQTFERFGNGPIMAATLNEPVLIGDAFVRIFEGRYHMWYIYGTGWKTFLSSETPERIYKIAHATSTDGITWERNARQIITDRLNADECQALPTVFFLDGTYHMYFCYRQAHGFRTQTNSAYRIGYATSNDLINWWRDDNSAGINVSTEGWDSDMQCYPNVFQCDGQTFMVYNGNQFGRRGFGLAILEG